MAYYRLLHLLHDIEVNVAKNNKYALYKFYALVKHGVSTNQSVSRVPSIS